MVTKDSNDWKCYSYVFPNYISLWAVVKIFLPFNNLSNIQQDKFWKKGKILCVQRSALFMIYQWLQAAKVPMKTKEIRFYEKTHILLKICLQQ